MAGRTWNMLLMWGKRSVTIYSKHVNLNILYLAWLQCTPCPHFRIYELRDASNLGGIKMKWSRGVNCVKAVFSEKSTL